MIEFAGGSLSLNAHVPLCTLRFRAGLPRLTRKILCAPHGQQEQDLFSGFISNFPPLRCLERKLCECFSVAAPQVCGSPRVYVPDGTDARDDGKKCAQVCGLVAAPVPAVPAVAAPRATMGRVSNGQGAMCNLRCAPCDDG